MCRRKKSERKHINTASPKWGILHMTIYTAVRMKDGVHYIASNITQCTKQLKAMKCTGPSPSQQITYWFRKGSIAICNFLNLNADMKRAKSDNCCCCLQTGAWPPAAAGFRYLMVSYCTLSMILVDSDTHDYDWFYWLCVLPYNMNYIVIWNIDTFCSGCIIT